MINAHELTIGTRVVLYPFEGVSYEEPSDEIILDIQDIETQLDKLGITNKGNARNQILNHFKKRNILPLRYNSPQIPIILRLMGFIFGDGVLTFVKGKKGLTQFYAKEEDLATIKKDINELGFLIPRISRRQRHHRIVTNYGISEFDFEETSLIKKSTEFALLFLSLGVPAGKKTHVPYRLPQWIKKAPLWQKRLFIAALFGAELSTPKSNPKNPRNFYMPQLNMSKAKNLQQNAIEFLLDIRQVLEELGIETLPIVPVPGNNYQGKQGLTLGFRMLFNGKEANLKKFFSVVGYEYNQEKQKLSCLASAYIQHKELIREIRQLQYSADGTVQCRVMKDFVTYQNFVASHSIGEYGFILDEIEEIDIKDYQGHVYDITVNHKDHNFIANNFVTHNCGMRLLTTNLTIKDVEPKLKPLVDHLFKTVPVGVGCKGFVKASRQQFDEVMSQGVQWCVDNGYGWQEDVEHCESHGRIDWADPSKVSDKARKRGIDQLGTLGSGNHYLEIQEVKAENIVDEKLAKTFSIFPGQVVVMIHCGSRGFGHQIATDYLQVFDTAMKKYGITVNDRELACAPFNSKEGQDYYKAMACAANMAFANRQVILHRVREAFEHIFKQQAEDMNMHLIYDVAHNVAKVEEHLLDGQKKKLVVHRKGSTRAFPPGHPELASIYQTTGQPVILGGSMETGSSLLVGTQKAMDETFGSTAHGSGRTMSRTQAKHQIRGDQLQKDMEQRGIYVRTSSYSGLAEEAGAAYKDIDQIVETLKLSGISKPVCRLIPRGNVKG